MLYALSIGFLQQVFFPFPRPVLALTIGLFLTATLYACIPIALLSINLFLVLAILITLNGYFQSYAWPNLLMIVNSQYDSKKESIQLGIWSTNTNIGNILGFVICQYLVLNNQLPW
jgi:sugar phosphate permease